VANAAGAVAALIKNDPLVASNFWLEIAGVPYSMLTEVSGLDMEVEVVEVKQVSEKGQYVAYKAQGQAKSPGELTIKRVAPIDMASDKIWTWFNTIRDKGMGATDRTGQRKDGSVVVYDSANTELARWNFYNAWPNKISSDSFSATSTEAASETITLQIERLERKK
jgi:phage tail-like protein